MLNKTIKTYEFSTKANDKRITLTQTQDENGDISFAWGDGATINERNIQICRNNTARISLTTGIDNDGKQITVGLYAPIYNDNIDAFVEYRKQRMPKKASKASLFRLNEQTDVEIALILIDDIEKTIEKLRDFGFTGENINDIIDIAASGIKSKKSRAIIFEQAENARREREQKEQADIIKARKENQEKAIQDAITALVVTGMFTREQATAIVASQNGNN